MNMDENDAKDKSNRRNRRKKRNTRKISGIWTKMTPRTRGTGERTLEYG